MTRTDMFQDAINKVIESISNYGVTVHLVSGYDENIIPNATGYIKDEHHYYKTLEDSESIYIGSDVDYIIYLLFKVGESNDVEGALRIEAGKWISKVELSLKNNLTLNLTTTEDITNFAVNIYDMQITGNNKGVNAEKKEGAIRVDGKLLFNLFSN